MNAIVDANIIFSALLKENSKQRIVLLDERNMFFSPDYLAAELLSKQERLLKYTSLNKNQLDELMRMLIRRIHFVPECFVSMQSRKKAWKLCWDVDEADVPYVALAIEMHFPLWTGDEKLKRGLRKKNFEEFVEL